jgi:hypothetical protein
MRRVFHYLRLNSLGRRLKIAYNFAVPKKSDPSPRRFNVGDRVKVSLPPGHIVDATVKAVIERTDGLYLQVDYAHEVHSRRVVNRCIVLRPFLAEGFETSIKGLVDRKLSQRDL